MTNFNIDLFQLAFLAEACIPPQPIARHSFWYELCDMHYHKMTDDERLLIFEWISTKLDLNDEECRYFFARYNPENQYVVATSINGKVQKLQAFRFNENFQITKYQTINEDYIIEYSKT